MSKVDLRVKRTKQLLTNALSIALNNKNFNQLTVNDLCELALVSRASFYVHFSDKYNLLEYWLSDLNKMILKNVYDYKVLEVTVNQFINSNKRVITNILNEASGETIDLVYQFILSIVNASIKARGKDITDNDNVVLSKFCSGGILNMLSQLVKEKFLTEEAFVTPYSYEMIRYIMNWDGNK